jgi:hypothetical protein
MVSGMPQGALRVQGVLQVDEASKVHLGKTSPGGIAP